MRLSLCVFVAVVAACMFPACTAVKLRPQAFANSVGMEFVLIPAGNFLMGTEGPPCSPPKMPAMRICNMAVFEDDPLTEGNEMAEAQANKVACEAQARSEYQARREEMLKEFLSCVRRVGNDEIPQHRVAINKSFYLATTEVTQAQWYAVMGNNPAYFNAERVGVNSMNHPVEMVSWNDVQEFIRRLNAKEGSNVYRLPTEAEWEYACRAGSTGLFSFGDNWGELMAYEWFNENSGGRTHPVATKQPNTWGLYDMHGNVGEWVQDWYGNNYYSSSPSMDPVGPAVGSLRGHRGGSFRHGDGAARAANRGRGGRDPAKGHVTQGFRLARSVR